MAVVRAYTVEAREIADFGRLNDEYLRAEPAPGARAGRASGRSWGWCPGSAGSSCSGSGARRSWTGASRSGPSWPSTATSRTWRGRRSRSAGRCRACSAASRSMRRIAEILDDGARPPDEARSRRMPGHRGRPSPARASAGHRVPGPHVRLRGAGARARRRQLSRAPEGGARRRRGSDGQRQVHPRRCSCAGSSSPRAAPCSSAASTCGDLPLARLRRSVGYVPQEAFLFSRSLRDNVLSGRRRGRDEHVRGAAAAAGLSEEVDAFPDGWDTVVGERGLTLSGGQRQRAALARALAGDAAVPRPGRRARVGGRGQGGGDPALARGRPSAGAPPCSSPTGCGPPQEADAIVVLDEGRVVEKGAHADLVAAGGALRAALARCSSSRTSSPMHDDEVLGRAYDARLDAAPLGGGAAPPRLVLLSLALFPLTAAVELLQPYLVKLAIDDHILARDWSGSGGSALLFLVSLAALYGSCGSAQAYVTQLTGQRVIHDLRRRALRAPAVARRALLRPEPGGPADDARPQRRRGDQRAVHQRRGRRSSATC